MIGELRVSDDVSAGAWIAPRLETAPGTVTGTVPSGFPAYVRICHPAQDPDGRLVPWSRVAQMTGRRVHPLMQWHALLGSPEAPAFDAWPVRPDDSLTADADRINPVP